MGISPYQIWLPLRVGAVIFSVLAADLLGQVDSRAISLQVRQHEQESKEFTAKRSDGENDFITRRVRVLEINCRLVGSSVPQSVVIEWFFFGKEPLNNKVFAWSTGSETVQIGLKGQTIRAVSSPLASSSGYRSEGTRRYKTQDSVRPHGWAVRVLSNGKVVKTSESTAGLLKLTK